MLTELFTTEMLEGTVLWVWGRWIGPWIYYFWRWFFIPAFKYLSFCKSVNTISINPSKYCQYLCCSLKFVCITFFYQNCFSSVATNPPGFVSCESKVLGSTPVMVSIFLHTARIWKFSLMRKGQKWYLLISLSESILTQYFKRTLLFTENYFFRCLLFDESFVFNM